MRINIAMNSPAMLEAAYAGNTRGRQTALRHNKPRQRSCRGVHSEHYVFDTKLRAFGGVTRKQGGSAWLPPEFLFDGFAMNQFKLIAICLGLASSALGTCTSSMPSL
jgi:hypothetical protein